MLEQCTFSTERSSKFLLGVLSLKRVLLYLVFWKAHTGPSLYLEQTLASICLVITLLTSFLHVTNYFWWPVYGEADQRPHTSLPALGHWATPREIAGRSLFQSAGTTNLTSFAWVTQVGNVVRRSPFPYPCTHLDPVSPYCCCLLVLSIKLLTHPLDE